MSLFYELLSRSTDLGFLSSQQLSRSHFPDGIEPLDLFLSTQGIPSAQRARAFLFLVWHYYEGPSTSDPNPFHDDFSRANPGKVPLLSPGTAGTENIDDESEIRFGDEMKAARLNHLEKVRLEGEEMKRKVASGEIAEGSEFGLRCWFGRAELNGKTLT